MRTVVIFIYSLFMVLVAAPIFLFLSLFIKGYRKQLFNRTPLAKAAPKKENTVLIYCSSAGELEQGMAIDFELQKTTDLKAIFVINSVSGTEFIKKRGYEIEYFSAPLDNIFSWKKIFNTIKPKATIVIRHDFWPSFVFAANKYSLLIFANISSTGESGLSFYKKDALKLGDKILTVNEISSKVLDQHNISSINVGDSKYDRSNQIAHSNRKTFEYLFPNEQRLIVFGSCWHADIETTLVSFDKVLNLGYKIVLAPHDISDAMIKFLENKVSKYKSIKFSSFTSERSSNWDILIVDTIGNLQDIYAHCYGALIGGAFHSKVHNVLEPAAFEKYISFGPLYHNSHEAIDLVESELASVIENNVDFETWIDKITSNQIKRANLDGKLGASKKITEEIIRSISE